jgi:hypothetical protein
MPALPLLTGLPQFCPALPSMPCPALLGPRLSCPVLECLPTVRHHVWRSQTRAQGLCVASSHLVLDGRLGILNRLQGNEQPRTPPAAVYGICHFFQTPLQLCCAGDKDMQVS